jgi:hypothetical protein
MATDPPIEKLNWQPYWRTWKVGDKTIGVSAAIRGKVQDPIFFGPLSKYKGVRETRYDIPYGENQARMGKNIEHLSDKEYVFNHRVVQHDGKPHFGGYFNATNQNLYKLMIDSINSSSDASVNSIITDPEGTGRGTGVIIEEDEGYIWYSETWTDGSWRRTQSVPLNFDTSGHILPVLFTAVYQKEKKTPISDFRITASDLPIDPPETLHGDKFDNKLLNLMVKKSTPNTVTHDMAKNTLKFRRLKEFGIDYPRDKIDKLKDIDLGNIDPSDPDDVAKIRAEVAALVESERAMKASMAANVDISGSTAASPLRARPSARPSASPARP